MQRQEREKFRIKCIHYFNYKLRAYYKELNDKLLQATDHDLVSLMQTIAIAFKHRLSLLKVHNYDACFGEEYNQLVVTHHNALRRYYKFLQQSISSASIDTIPEVLQLADKAFKAMTDVPEVSELTASHRDECHELADAYNTALQQLKQDKLSIGIFIDLRERNVPAYAPVLFRPVTVAAKQVAVAEETHGSWFSWRW